MHLAAVKSIGVSISASHQPAIHVEVLETIREDATVADHGIRDYAIYGGIAMNHPVVPMVPVARREAVPRSETRMEAVPRAIKASFLRGK